MKLVTISEVNCNKCLNVNITEKQQIHNEPHICTVYDKRVFHKVADGYHVTTVLKPCEECVKDKYMFARLVK